MHGYDLVIEDSEITNTCSKINIFLSDFQNTLISYQEAMETYATTVVKSGATHDAIICFLKYIERTIAATNGIGAKCERLSQNFINDIERADDYLYNASITSMTRDFSNAEFNRLINMIDEPWTSVTDNIGDFFIGIGNKARSFICGESSKKSLLKDRKNLLDYNDETRQGLTILFERVYNYDIVYGKSCVSTNIDTGYFQTVLTCMKSLIKMLEEMSFIMNPTNNAINVETINIRLGDAIKELEENSKEVLNIIDFYSYLKLADVKKFSEAEWSGRVFSSYSAEISDFINRIDTGDSISMIIFNMFDVTEDVISENLKTFIKDPAMMDMLSKEDIYRIGLTRDALLDTIRDTIKSKNYSKSGTHETIDDFRTLVKNSKGSADKLYELLNDNNLRFTDGDNKGKKVLDGRTREAKAFKKFSKTMIGLDKVLKYGDEGAEILAYMFEDFTEGMEIIESFQANYSEDDVMFYAIEELKVEFQNNLARLYNGIFDATVDGSIDATIGAIAEISPSVKAVEGIKKFINTTEKIALGGSEKAKYNALLQAQVYYESESAYKKALEKVKNSDPNSDDYQRLLKDLENCYAFTKSNLKKTYHYMMEASSGKRKSYYHYCEIEIEELSMMKLQEPYLMTYEDFLNLKYDEKEHVEIMYEVDHNAPTIL